MNDEPASSEKGNLRERTLEFARRIVILYTSLPKDAAAQTLGKQVLRSGTSVGAHYREAQRSRSSAEFISKIEVALQELEETDYWLELLASCDIVAEKRLVGLRSEIGEMLAMLTSTVRTLKGRKK
jgi:four helix bundle protein